MMMVEFVRCSMMNEYVIGLERFSVDDLIDYYYDILFEICQSNCPMNDVEHDNHRFRQNLKKEILVRSISRFKSQLRFA